MVLGFNHDLDTARRWNKEVNSPFIQLMDPAMLGTPGDAGSTYRSWGFKKSFIGVWSPESLRFYSDAKLGGTELHPSFGQDVHRMGGDLVVDGNGRVVLDHYSETNNDRPSVDKTLLPLARALDVQRRTEKAITLNVVGYSSCPSHQRAVKHASTLQESGGEHIKLDVKTFGNRGDFQKWLCEHRTTLGADERAASHKTCPCVWMVDSDSKKVFIGGCDDLIALSDKGGLNCYESGSWIPGETVSVATGASGECKS